MFIGLKSQKPSFIYMNSPIYETTKYLYIDGFVVFQYSSTHSVSEVTRESFNSCNTTNVLKTFSNGNTTVPLTKPGQRYFVCGNKLHCLGGMKLQMKVQGNQDYAPVGAPQATTGSDLPNNPSSRNNIPNTSSAFSHIGGAYVIVPSLIGLVVFMLWNNVKNI